MESVAFTCEFCSERQELAALSRDGAPTQRMNLEQVPDCGRIRGLPGIPLLTLRAELARERNGLDQWFPPRDG